MKNYYFPSGLQISICPSGHMTVALILEKKIITRLWKSSTVIFLLCNLNFTNQRLEFLLSYSAGGTKLEKIFDVDGNDFSNIQSPERSWIDHVIGTQIDLTDNHLDPSEGLRIGLLHSKNEL